jgi:hypothetical protein
VSIREDTWEYVQLVVAAQVGPLARENTVVVHLAARVFELLAVPVHENISERASERAREREREKERKKES